MKKRIKPTEGKFPLLKFDLKMKLSTLLLLTSLFAMHANESYAQRTKVTVDLENATVSELIDVIESKTEFRFIYKVKAVDLNRKISIKTKNERVARVLNRIFKGTQTTFDIKDRQIILTQLTRSPAKDEGAFNFPNVVAQQSVSGTVKDAEGTPLPGASIVEKGTTNGTQTDFDGNFSISVTGSNAILVISYLGFSKQEIAIGEQTTINVVLQQDSAKLDEVVVVGYGTQKKSDVTGAISQIKLDENSPGAYSSLDKMISGQASGIHITSESGDPGTATNIRIRGTSTIGDNQPLWVIDGFPTVGNPTRNLNVQDIESIEVLKSTSAAAIYGARASNGVIIVTTRRGKDGKTRASYNTYFGFQQSSDSFDVLSVDEYVDFQNELGNDFSSFRGQNFVDWQDLITDNGAIIQDHNINVSAGNENSNYSVTGGYFDQESVTKGAEFKRYNVRVNSDFKVGKLLKFGESLQITHTKSETRRISNGQIGFVTHAAVNAPFYEPFGDGPFGYNLVDSNTAGAATSITNNVLAAADSRVAPGEFSAFGILGNLYAELKIFDGLTYRISGGINYNAGGSAILSRAFNGSLGRWVGTDVAGARFTRTSTKDLTTNLTNLLRYEKQFGKHSFNVLAGYEETVFDSELIGTIGLGLPFEDIQIAANADDVLSLEEIDQFALVGWLGRLAYNYDDKYLLTVNIRNDKSSRFAEDRRSQTFPSFSVGWNISNESFFPENDIVNTLKLRGGWGQSGNQFTGENFAYIPSLNLGGSVIIGADQNAVLTPVPLGLTSPDLTWEVVNQTDFGIDARLFNRKLDLTLEYYNRRTEDILLSVQAPGAGGAGLQEALINAGQVTNKGFEASLGYNFSAGKVDFNIGANITTVDNVVDKLDSQNTPIVATIADDFAETNITEVGSSIGSFYGWVMDGIFQNQGEIDAHAFQNDNTAPGDIRFSDLNGDGVINGDDRKAIGSSIPGLYYGLNIGANYKGFDFTMLFQGVGDVQLLNGARFELERMRNTSNQSRTVLGRWTPQNPSTSIPRATADDPNGNGRMSTRWVENAGFLRMKNLQVGYTLSDDKLNKWFGGHVSSLRLYSAVQNAFVLTNYSGLDPEVTVGANFTGSSDSPIANGQDDGRTPTPITYQVGLQVSF